MKTTAAKISPAGSTIDPDSVAPWLTNSISSVRRVSPALCRLKTSANKAKRVSFIGPLPAATDFRRQKMQQGLNNDYHSPRNNIRPSQGADHERSFQRLAPIAGAGGNCLIAAIIGGAWWFLEHRDDWQ